MRFGLSLILLAATASGSERWVEIHVGPFHVISDAGSKAARERLNLIEQLRYALGVDLGKVGIGKEGLQTVWPMDLILFANQAEAAAHPTAKTFVDGGAARLSVLSADAPIPPEWLRSLARLLIDENSGRMPDSIETGLCDLFSTIQVKNTHVLLGAPPGDLSAERLRAWARMQMLATLPDYSGKVRVYLNNMQQTGDESVAVRNAFDTTPAKLDALVDAYIKAGKFEAVSVGGEPLDPNRDFPERVLDKLEMDEVLAELASDGKTFPPDSPRGLAEQRGRENLEAAIRANPHWAEPYSKLAELETDPAKEIQELKMAATLDPRNAENWQDLAEAQAAAHLYVEAAKSWSQAERNAADDAERARIHTARMALDTKRADFTEDEKRREVDDAAKDLERVKAAAAAEVHAAEKAADARADARLKESKTGSPTKPPAQKPVDWWDDPKGEKVEGKLTRVDCFNGPLRLTIQKEGGAVVRVAVRNLKSLTVHGADEAVFGCGASRPTRKIRLVYQPQPDAKLGTLGDVLVVEFP